MDILNIESLFSFQEVEEMLVDDHVDVSELNVVFFLLHPMAQTGWHHDDDYMVNGTFRQLDTFL